jgi:molybdenum cofactor biosynthesis protein B
MLTKSTEVLFKPINIAVMTISDTRTENTDSAGQLLLNRLDKAGHILAEKVIVKDSLYQIRAVASKWIADSNIQAIVTTGGTGMTARDNTPEAMNVLFDKEVAGFGELFRCLSYHTIRTSTIQSRAIAGIANATVIFCLPGSPGACKDAWDGIIVQQLDNRTQPCNMIDVMPRMKQDGLVDE